MDRKCYICGATENLHRHHVFFGTANRKNSEKYGMVVDLCCPHHNGSNYSVHLNHELDVWLKREFQRKFEEEYSREEFMRVFGRNFL